METAYDMRPHFEYILIFHKNDPNFNYISHAYDPNNFKICPLWAILLSPICFYSGQIWY